MFSQIVEGFEISPTKTQVALVTFASNAKTEFYLNSNQYVYLFLKLYNINLIQKSV